MRIISIDDPKSVQEAVETLRKGGVIVYPTDTAYGLGADATNAAAVQKVIDIKERDGAKPIPMIVGDIDSARRFVMFSEKAEKLASTFWPGPLTLGLPTVDNALAHILRGEVSIGVRVPNLLWCQQLTIDLGHPVTSTSANASGTPAEYSLDGVRQSLGQQGSLVDLWIDGGVLSGGPVSTVVAVQDDQITIKREGAISRENIEKVLG